MSGFQGHSKASIFRYILASEPVMFVVITPFKKIVQKLSNHKLKRKNTNEDKIHNHLPNTYLHFTLKHLFWKSVMLSSELLKTKFRYATHQTSKLNLKFCKHDTFIS